MYENLRINKNLESVVKYLFSNYIKLFIFLRTFIYFVIKKYFFYRIENKIAEIIELNYQFRP